MANHWKRHGNVDLHHLADEGRGFFVKVSINEERQLVVLGGLDGVGPLEGYAVGVTLPLE